VTQAVDSLEHLNKELPAAEGARCRQMRQRTVAAVSRAQTFHVPKLVGRNTKHPKHKERFLESWLPPAPAK